MNNATGFAARVLLIADDGAIRSLLTAGLSADPQTHFDVTVAASDADALAAQRQARQSGVPFPVAIVQTSAAPGCPGLRTAAQLLADDARLQLALYCHSAQPAWSNAIDLLGRSERVLFLQAPIGDWQIIQTARVLSAKWRLTPATVDLSGISSAVKEIVLPQPAGPVPTGGAPFDMGDLLERCMGNKAFLEKLLNKFAQRIGGEIDGIDKAIATGDRNQTARLAHSLKGSAANVSAPALSIVARELEALSTSGDFALATECLKRLRIEVDRCLASLPGTVSSPAETSGSCTH